MVDLSRLSAMNRTQQMEATASQTPRTQMTQAEELGLKQMYTGKKVTKADMERALNEPSGANAVKTLLGKSPLGVEFPKDGNFESYVPAYMTDEAGASFYRSNDGGLIRVVDEGADTIDKQPNGNKSVTYTKGNYTQSMLYDKNGNLISGKMLFKDEYGSTEKTIIFNKLTNGKFEVLTQMPDGHSFEECKL